MKSSATCRATEGATSSKMGTSGIPLLLSQPMVFRLLEYRDQTVLLTPTQLCGNGTGQTLSACRTDTKTNQGVIQHRLAHIPNDAKVTQVAPSITVNSTHDAQGITRISPYDVTGTTPSHLACRGVHQITASSETKNLMDITSGMEVINQMLDQIEWKRKRDEKLKILEQKNLEKKNIRSAKMVMNWMLKQIEQKEKEDKRQKKEEKRRMMEILAGHSLKLQETIMIKRYQMKRRLQMDVYNEIRREKYAKEKLARKLAASESLGKTASSAEASAHLGVTESSTDLGMCSYSEKLECLKVECTHDGWEEIETTASTDHEVLDNHRITTYPEASEAVSALTKATWYPEAVPAISGLSVTSLIPCQGGCMCFCCIKEEPSHEQDLD